MESVEEEIVEETPDESVTPSKPSPGAPVKAYKTTLCQFYLQGPCKNGDDCSYAHGTSELRTPSGKALKDLEPTENPDGPKPKKHIKKTKLCEKFLQFGSCSYGATCDYAHGVRELQKALEAEVDMGEKELKNPAFKTSLCKNYMNGLFCSFADKCQYAHGRHELREKQHVEVADMSQEMKKKLLDKAKTRPDYKTRLCQNFEEKEHCEYGELCNFAHGKDELKEPTEFNAQRERSTISKKPQHKTVMCRNLSNCKYGVNCQYAHSVDELNHPTEGTGNGMRQTSDQFHSNSSIGYKTTLCKYFTEKDYCSKGSACQFAHGYQDLRGGAGGSGGSSAADGFKTAMCQDMVKYGTCARGSRCTYAHSTLELRSSNNSGDGMSSHMNPIVAAASYSNPLAAAAAAVASIKTINSQGRYKTMMCSNIAKTGNCSRGSDCNFAHSQMELMAARHADPKYKTMLCQNWRDTGSCEKGDTCMFAHGEMDLKTKGGLVGSAMSGSDALSSMFGMSSSSSGNSNFNSAGNPKYKTILCQQFMSKGFCDRKERCSFAHGENELTNRETYKTNMCKNVQLNGHCPKANVCHFAHSQGELRSPSSSNNSYQSSHGSFQPSNFSGSSMDTYSSSATKRKSNAKTMLCQNFSKFGECQYGDRCNFAHGESELQVKRPRF